MTDELYNEIFAEGEARGKRLERKRIHDLLTDWDCGCGDSHHETECKLGIIWDIITAIEKGEGV